MLELKKDDQCCLLANLMEEAEASWKAVLKRETIASLSADFFKEGYDDKITSLGNWIQEKMVL